MPQSHVNTASNQALVALVAKVLPVWIRQLATSRKHSEEAVSEMLSAFSEIGPLLGAAAQTPSGQLKPASELVEQMYVGFQYEDRINQMLSLLLDDMQRMLTALNDPAQQSGDGLNHEIWLQRLESQYAMAEQRRGHSGDASLDGNATATDTDSNTDFF